MPENALAAIGTLTAIADLSSVVSLTVPAQAHRLILSISTQPVRMSFSSTDPTATLGTLLPANDSYNIPVAPGQVIKLIETAASATGSYQYSG